MGIHDTESEGDMGEMSEKRKTGIIIGLCGVILAAREAYVLLKSDPDATESEVIWSISTFPMVPFIAGFLAGHLFWQTTDTYEREERKSKREKRESERKAKGFE